MARRRPGLVRPLLRLAAAGAIGVAARDRLAEPDEQARKLVCARRSDALDAALPVLTDLGSTYAIAGASAALALTGHRRAARDVAAAGTIAWVAAQGLKALYRRARPYDVGEVAVMVRRPAGTSFPSGHPAVAAAIAEVLAERVAPPARGVLERIPRLVAFSRVYVGVHYPTDVIGGLLLGRAVADLWRRYAPD